MQHKEAHTHTHTLADDDSSLATYNVDYNDIFHANEFLSTFSFDVI